MEDYRKITLSSIMANYKICITAGISSSSIIKLVKNENVTTGVLVKICKSFNWLIQAEREMGFDWVR